jgi:hypothetical protein
MLAQLFAAAIARCPAAAVAVIKSARGALENATPTENAAPTMQGISICSSDEFIARQIESHREAIALYEDEVGSSDARLRVTAQRILPQLHRHLAMLESLQFADGHHRDADDRHRDAPFGHRS